MRRLFGRTLLVGLVLAVIGGALARPACAQTSPEQFLGFRPGSDRQLADYTQITAYLRKLEAESPYLKVLTIGATSLKKPIVMAVITTPENMKNLDRIKAISHQLRDARGLTPAMAAQLAADGKVIVALGCSIHASEIGASQMALELAYRLASGKTPFDIESVLKDVVVLLIPSVNPDGEQMITEWYRQYVGTEYEGGPMPWLYHIYAGHDDNRDFYMFNLPEARAEGDVLFNDWLPQIFISEHQSGTTSPRQFISPYGDPMLPDVHPLVWTGIEVMGANMRYDLEAAGKPGIVHGEGYTGWWTGGEDEVAWPHNIVAFLTEAASARIATPIYVSANELGPKLTEPRMNVPHPWPGGWWRLADIVDNELILNFSAINTAHQRKSDFLLNFYRMNRDGIEAPGGDGAFVISADQHDPLTALKMADILRIGGLELSQAETGFVAAGKSYPAGSLIVPLAQPYRAQAITLLDRQKYPDMRDGSGGPPIAPYDNAGWTLPFLMGVATDRVERLPALPMRPLAAVALPAAAIPSGRSPYLVLDAALNASYAVAAGVLTRGGSVARALAPLVVGDRTYAPGAFVIRNDAAAQQALPALLARWPVAVAAMDGPPTVTLGRLTPPRIGVYQSYQGNMDEGWTRYVLDDLSIPYQTLHNKDFKDLKDGGLAAKLDVLVLTSEDRDLIVGGKREMPPAGRGRPPANLPPAYAGGIGPDGVEAIKAFVKAGGTVIAINEAVGLAIRDLAAPAADALKGVDPSKFFAPNSIVRIAVDPTQPLGFGMPSETGAMFNGAGRSSASGSLAMDIVDAGRVAVEPRIVATYAGENPLMSGWMVGGEKMAGKAAVIDVKEGRGRLVLFGFRPLFRAQSHGTYKLFLNALFYPGLPGDGEGKP